MQHNFSLGIDPLAASTARKKISPINLQNWDSFPSIGQVSYGGLHGGRGVTADRLTCQERAIGKYFKNVAAHKQQ